MVALLMPAILVGTMDAAPAPAVPAAGAASWSAAARVSPGQTFTVPGAVRAAVSRDSYTVTAPAPRAPERIEAAAGVAGRVIRPADGPVSAQGGFGARLVPGCAACSTMHAGVDFAATGGSEARTVLDGDVIAAGASGGYGNMVLIRHATGLTTRYGHLDTIAVHVGQHVTAGTRIGLVGSTGISTGPHLHFEVITNGTPIDPVPWLHDHGIT